MRKAINIIIIFDSLFSVCSLTRQSNSEFSGKYFFFTRRLARTVSLCSMQPRPSPSSLSITNFMYLPLINGAEGHYGIILTEVVNYRRHCVRSVLTTEVKILPYRPLHQLIRYLLYGQTRNL